MTDRELQIAQAALRVAFAQRVTNAAADMLAGIDSATAEMIAAAAADLDQAVERVRALAGPSEATAFERAGIRDRRRH